MTAIERIINELERQGKTQADLCRHLGIKTSIIAGWKKQNSIPPAWHLVGISEFMNVSIDWLLTGKESIAEIPSIWELQDYQRQAAEEHYGNLTNEQAALLNNYEKLTLPNRREVQAIIHLKLDNQQEGRTESGTA